MSIAPADGVAFAGEPSFARDKDRERMGAGADGLVGEWVGKWK